MSEPLVWLPFDAAEFGELPTTLRYEKVDPRRGLPDSVTEVAFYVPGHGGAADMGTPIAHMKQLRVVQTMSAGVDFIRGYVPQNVTLCNARGAHDAATAELAVTLMLASLRDVPRYVHQQERHEWRRRVGGPALAEQRVLILGYGSIGQAIERRLVPFEVEIVRVARTARGQVHAFTELPDLLPTVDIVVVVAPLTEETTGIVDAAFLAAMREGALLVNVARGAMVVQDDLLVALAEGRIHAALDVVDPEPLPADAPLWDAPNLLLLPHVGGAADVSARRTRALVREQLWRFASGEPLHNVVTGAY